MDILGELYSVVLDRKANPVEGSYTNYLLSKGTEKIEYVGLRPGEKLYEELLLDKETDRATEKDRIYITEQETVEWETVEGWLETLETAIDQHQDIKKVLGRILPSYHEA